MSTHFPLLCAAGFISIGMFRLTDPLLPAIAEEFSSSIGSVAMTVTAFTLGYGMFQLVYGPLGDRIGKLRVMAAALMVAALAAAACAWAGSVAALTALRFAGGMAAGAIVPLAIAHIGDTVSYGARQTTIGHFLAATVTGQIVGGSLAGMFAEFFGWRLAFLAFGIAGMAVAARIGLAAMRMPRPATPGAGHVKVTHLALLGRRDTRVVWGGVFLEGCFVMGAMPYAGAALRHQFGLDYLTIGLILGSFGVGGLLYSASVRWLVANLGERGMVVLGGVLVTLSYVLLATAAFWQTYILALALVGGGFFCMHSTLQTRGTELAPQARGTAMSGFALSLFLGQGAGVYGISHLVDGPGYGPAFAAAGAGSALVAAWLCIMLAARRPATGGQG
jgi:predicted MFS family arabinose efflux permease